MYTFEERKSQMKNKEEYIVCQCPIAFFIKNIFFSTEIHVYHTRQKKKLNIQFDKIFSCGK